MNKLNDFDEHPADGFTIVELIVVIVFSAGFILSISQLITYVNQSATESTRRTIASNLAYNNLRQFANGTSPLWFDCSGDDAGDSAPYSDGKTKPSATGQVLLNQTSSSAAVQQLPPPVIQKTYAIAPYGCGNSAEGMPIRIQSEVTYGKPPGKTIVHATYVGY